MAEQVIAEGGVLSLGSIGKYDSRFSEGETGSLRVGLRAPIPPSVINTLESTIKGRGVILNGSITQTAGTSAILNGGIAEQTTGGPAILNIPFRVGLAPLIWLGIALVAVSAIYILVTNWKIVKTVAGAALPFAPLLPYIIVGLAIFLFLLWVGVL